MSQDDPFDDRTLIQRPSPGGRGRAAPAAGLGAAPPAAAAGSLNLESLPGANPLVAAALPLLSLASRLRGSAQHADVAGLQQKLAGEIKGFEDKALALGLGSEPARMATYALCSLLDESVLNTPWGYQSFWSQRSLLILFHKEAWGGEKFFQIVDYLARQPAQNLHLLELCYLCLSLGFEGRYRIMQNGASELARYRDELYQLIQRVRGDFERSLSPRWQGLQDVRNPLLRLIPWWVVAAAAAAVLFLAYLGFLFAINDLSAQTRARLYALGQEPVKTAAPLPPPVPKPAVPGRVERFTQLLREEIGQNWVEVIDDRTLRIRNSFPAGSDQVKPAFVDMLKKIAGELGSGQDRVLVTGHTDDIPIHNARFPSNWDLSDARARHVADILLASGALAGRVEARGRADREPLAPNDSPENRAVNRRVDILVQ